jgi:tRNA pseudouridine38-40 synthase
VPTWKLTLEYDGTPFVGWQRQRNGLAIQEVVEAALARLHGGEPVGALAAGRTDSGVHARGQVVSIRPAKSLAYEAYARGLNTLLPEAIAVRHVEPAPDAFDARRWARGKRYVYRVFQSPSRSPLRRHQVWQVFRPLDVEAVRRAASHLTGRHHFGSFRASDCEANTAVRTLRRLDVDVRGDEVVFTVEATAFLKHMVRNLVGTLVEVGQEKRAADDMPALLAARARPRAGRTAPPEGLCLDEVFYDLAAGPPDDDDP